MYQCNYCMTNCNPTDKVLKSNKVCGSAHVKRYVNFKDCVSKVTVNPEPSKEQEQVIKWFLAYA